jgi:hypothetical protein
LSVHTPHFVPVLLFKPFSNTFLPYCSDCYRLH